MARFVWCLLLLASAGCSDGRTARSKTELYHCAVAADCLSGYTCVCNFCQPTGQAPYCPDGGSLADGGSADAGSTSDDAQAAEVCAPSDAALTPGACNLVDWTACGQGQGCYFDPASQSSGCDVHGCKGLMEPCDPKGHECAVATIDGQPRPLRCDAIDAKCYPTCNAKSGQPACPSTMICYQLESNKVPWPEGAGICAPK
jgi:hypothetical protein